MADNNTEKQRVQELTDKLEQGLQDLFNSDSYRDYLATMSKFHNYSFNITLLIAMQKPDATLVAGYKTWQKKNLEFPQFYSAAPKAPATRRGRGILHAI